MSSRRLDVLVVGAGPAGSACAVHLARRGLEVALIDRRRFPRDKVCGDFVGPVAMLELERLGVGGSDYERTSLVSRAALFLDGELLISRAFPRIDGLRPCGRVIPRAQLDAWLVDTARTAGARVLEPGQVVALEPSGRGLTAVIGPDRRRRIPARLVIGADGSNSCVARFLRGFPPPPGDRLIAMRAYFDGVSGPRRQAEIYFSGASFPGYAWVFPTGPSTANVGVGMVLDTVPPVTEHLRTILDRLAATDPAVKRRLGRARRTTKVVGWPLTTYNPWLPLAGDRTLLVGDAAGLINPINGEGIQNALLSARWAAEVVVDALDRDDSSAEVLAAYAARVEAELRADMALSRLIVRGISNRALNPVWLELLRTITSRAAIDDSYARITGGVLAGMLPVTSAASSRIVAGTARDLLSALGLRPGDELRDPRVMRVLGREAARVGLLALSGTSGRGLIRWALSALLDLAELAEQAERPAAGYAHR
jgi:geranylgeranyl reductase family protein